MKNRNYNFYLEKGRMEFLSKDRGRTYSKLLPPYISCKIEEEERNWKEEIFVNLPKSIETDEFDWIEHCLTCLEIYIRSDTYSLTHEEIGTLLQILYNFIITVEHWKLVSSACLLFNLLYKPRYHKFNFTFEWKPLYAILQKIVFSRSKFRRQKPTPALFQSLINLIRECTTLFPSEATQEMLDLWLPMLDPHHHSFVLAHCLLCLFLPVNANMHHLWFDKFMSIWPMYRSMYWDFQWLTLFARLSGENLNINWTPYLPFIFNTLSAYIGIPLTILEISLPPINDYPHDIYQVFFFDCSGPQDLFPLFVVLINNIMTTDSKLEVRKQLERVFYMLQPYCSPAAQSEDGPDSELPIAFVNYFLRSYLKRVRREKKGKPHKLPFLKREDHEWFVQTVLPLVVMERFTCAPRINYLKDLAELSPGDVLPKIMDTVMRSFEVEKLEQPALRTLTVILLVLINEEGITQTLHDMLLRFAGSINFMKLQYSIRIFAMFVVFARCDIQADMVSDVIETIIDRCIVFLEHVPATDLRQASPSMRSMISGLLRTAPHDLIVRLLRKIEGAKERLSPKGIRDLIEAFNTHALEVFEATGINARDEKDFAILLGLTRRSSGFIVPNLDTISGTVIAGIDSEKKEVRDLAISCAKHLLTNLLTTMPLPIRSCGYIDMRDAVIEWHCPSAAEVDAAGRLFDRVMAHAEGMMRSGEQSKQVTAMEVAIAAIKGISCAVSNSQLTVIKDRDEYEMPKLERFVAEELRGRWIHAMDFVVGLLAPETPDKVLSAALKAASTLALPRDRIGILNNGFFNEMKYVSETTSLCSMPNKVTPDLALMRALRMYSFRHSVMFPVFTEEVRRLLMPAVMLSGHTSLKVQNRVAMLVQEISAAYPTQFGCFFWPLLDNLDFSEPKSLSGIALSLCSCCQLTFTDVNFELIAHIAATFCQVMPTSLQEDTPRSLRQFILMTLDIVDLNERQNREERFVEIRRKAINKILENVGKAGDDIDVDTYATALIIALSTAQPVIINCSIFEYLLAKITHDNNQVCEVIVNNIPMLIEHLIPRVPRVPRVTFDKITPENYDRAKFVDRPSPGLSTTEPLFMTRDQLFDRDFLSKYFDDPEEHIKIHRLLCTYFCDNKDFIVRFSAVLVNSQIHQEESYCKARVQFWTSLLRLFGSGLAVTLLEVMDSLTGPSASIAHHVIAGEMLSAIMFATKGFTYAQIMSITLLLLPFITKVVRDGESEFQSVWFISIVCGISDRDPRRFFWFFDHLLESFPSAPKTIKDIKNSSLIVDILLEFGWRMDDVLERTVEKGIMPMFATSVQSFEQIRECAIRAVSSIMSCSFKLNEQTVSPRIRDLYRDVFIKAGDSFIIPWFTAQFTSQMMSSFIINRLLITHIRTFIDLCVGKREEEEKKARVCLLHMVRSNWLWAVSEQPLTPPHTEATIRRVLAQLDPRDRVWQEQTVLLLLIESFIGTNFFHFSEAVLGEVMEDFVMPMLENSNFDVQDSAAEMLSFLLKSSMSLRQSVGDLVKRCRTMIYAGKTKNTRMGGVKGLVAIIHSTLLFDTVPEYVYAAFECLQSTHGLDSALEPVITQALNDFWALHEANLTADVVEQLSPFRETTRPSYFC